MKTKYNKYSGEWEVIDEDKARYNETSECAPTSRVLAGSSDDDFDSEYVGYGDIDGIPVKAVYLLHDDDMRDNDGNPYDDEGCIDWDTALEQGRIIVDVDNLTDAQYNTLIEMGVLTCKK